MDILATAKIMLHMDEEIQEVWHLLNEGDSNGAAEKVKGILENRYYQAIIPQEKELWFLEGALKKECPEKLSETLPLFQRSVVDEEMIAFLREIIALLWNIEFLDRRELLEWTDKIWNTYIERYGLNKFCRED